MARESQPTPAARLVFDRGTVLVLAAGEGGLQDVPGLLWDPRVCAFRAPGHRHQQLLSELHRRGIAAVDDVRRAIEPSTSGSWRPIALRPYQQAAVNGW